MADSGDCDDPPAKLRNNRDATPKRKERSAIWKHFVKTSSSSAQCKICGATLQTPTGTTSPLVNHLKQHPTAMKDYRMTAAGAPEKDQPMTFDFVRRTDPLSEKKTQALNAKVAAMVALDLQPYSFVEDRGFKELMAEAVPNYRLPSRTTLSRTLVPRLFDDTRNKVKDEIRSAFEGGTAAVSFTCDMWPSRANESYVSFTCHLLTPGFRMKRFTLNTRHMAVNHSAENIAQMLLEMCAEWEIPDGCHKYIVTDNGRNIRAAVRRLPWTEQWEINAYSEEALLKKDSDPCDWWRTVGTFRYPCLAKLCPKYLPIPATSVPSERAFSVAGEVVSVRRERLLPHHVEQLIFLHNKI
ncbi:hypothetical protein MTO96_018121 [Rhipicephalus appendiculatus]